MTSTNMVHLFLKFLLRFLTSIYWCCSAKTRIQCLLKLWHLNSSALQFESCQWPSHNMTPCKHNSTSVSQLEKCIPSFTFLIGLIMILTHVTIRLAKLFWKAYSFTTFEVSACQILNFAGLELWRRKCSIQHLEQI